MLLHLDITHRAHTSTKAIHSFTYIFIQTSAVILSISGFTRKLAVSSWSYILLHWSFEAPRWQTMWFQLVGSRCTTNLCVCITLHVLCFYLYSHLCWVQRGTSSQSHLRSINNLHLYFIYFTRGKSSQAFLLTNGSHTRRLTGHQSCIERALKRGH